MKKILCLTDFSDKANNAVVYANELAKKTSATLLFMHTCAELTDGSNKALLHPSGIRYTDTESRDKLYTLCMEFIKENKYSNVTYEYVVKEGNLGNKLNEVIKEKNIDLVICSVEGDVQPHQEYYGTILSELIQTTCCPLLAVPSGYKFKGIQTIVYAYDLENENTLEEKAIKFSKLLQAQLYIVSFSNEENEATADRLRAKLTQLKKESEYESMDVAIKGSTDMTQYLNQSISDFHAELVILENHKRNLYERLTERSFSKNFVFFSKIPVLIIRSEKE